MNNFVRNVTVLSTLLISLLTISPVVRQYQTDYEQSNFVSIDPFVPAPSLLPLASVKSTSTKVDTLSTINGELYRILACESGRGIGKPQQFNKDGTVLRGKINHSDVGAAQINEYYHLAESKRLGYDIYTLEGNIAYAKYLYDTQGSQPWSESESCWGK